MDTSDPEIIFDANGICNHCHKFDNEIRKRWFPNEMGRKKLEGVFSVIRQEGRAKEYDCIIGLSGGVDSSYLALIMKDYGLRPLVVHVDGGWNSELAVYNIEQIVKYCGYELFTHVVDWEEMRDLQLAYLRAGVANQDVPQDHVFFATLYHFAVKNNIRYVISGGNIATEVVFPQAWHHAAMDAINLHAIHRRYGSVKLRNYKTISFVEYYFYYPLIRKMKTVRPLNYLPYNKKEALHELIDTIGYKDYGRKHGESRFTKFFQNHYLPVKFGIDKRRMHLSSMILSGQMTRDEAVAELARPLYDPVELADDMRYVAKKLGISLEQLELMVRQPGHSYKEFSNWDGSYKLLKKIQGFGEKVFGRVIRNYA
jgi:N-acetyl sugar amidotransferase